MSNKPDSYASKAALRASKLPRSTSSRGAWPHLRAQQKANANANANGNAAPSASEGYTLLLEEAKGHPVFWSGTETVSKLVWKLTSNDINLTPRTISEVLEKFVAQDFLKHCNVSLATPEPAKVTTPIRMSDPLVSLWKDGRGRMVKLILDPSYIPDLSKELTNKYVLILSEMNKKKVLWDGKSPVATMIARTGEYHMMTTVETVLKKYLPSDYLRKTGLRMQLVVDKLANEGTRDVRLKDILGSLFKEKSAALRFWIEPLISGASGGAHGEAAEETSESRSVESFWLHGNWYEIREKVQYLLEALETYRRDRQIPENVDQRLQEEKSNLESSMRRRSRTIDEVWNRYETLKTSVEIILTEYPLRTSPAAPRPPLTVQPSSSLGVMELIPPSDSWNMLGNQRMLNRNSNSSCIDVVAHHLRTMGIEMYDEDERVSPAAGVAFTLAVVVVLCVVSSLIR